MIVCPSSAARVIRRFKSSASLLAARLVAPIYCGKGSIWVLHRVIPTAQLSTFDLNREMETTPECLDEALKSLKRWGYDFVSISEMTGRLAASDRARFACFTLDDGYRDSLEDALPVFKSHNAPFAVYITTSFARKGLIWWYALERLLLQKTELCYWDSGVEHRLRLKDMADKQAGLAALASTIRRKDRLQRNEFILNLFSENNLDPYVAARELTMNWDEIRRLAREKLATIGAHSVEHHNFSALSDQDLRNEMADSKRELEAELAMPVEHFSFPFGGRNAVGLREFAMAAACGYKTALTTRSGSIFTEHRNHIHSLPRRGIPDDPVEFQKTVLGWGNFRRAPRQRVVTL